MSTQKNILSNLLLPHHTTPAPLLLVFFVAGTCALLSPNKNGGAKEDPVFILDN